jgi:tetratricopeptide (TPR) repeat protein
MKNWRSQRISLLQQSGQSDEVLLLSRSLAADYPRDYYLQYQYAQNLANSGDYTAAYAWLDRILVPGAKWELSEEESLRELYAGFLQRQGRHREQAEYLAAWLKRNPDTSQPYAIYLEALVRGNRASQAEELAAQWLREGQVKLELSNPIYARLTAAVGFATGQGYNFYTNRVEERWHASLAQLVSFLARDTEYIATINKILNSNYRSTDSAAEVRKALAVILNKEADKLTPEQLVAFIDWVWSNAEITTDEWKKITAEIRKRWNAEKKPDVKDQFANPLLRILSRISNEEYLSFLRTQWKEGSEAYRVPYARALFNALLTQKWSAEREDEAFSLLDKLTNSELPAVALYSRVSALYLLTDAMIQARNDAAKPIEHPEKLTRTELQKKQAENLKQAREGFAERLRKEAAGHAKPFASWLTIERLWIDVQLERDFKQVGDACWEILDAPPIQAKADDEGSLAGKLLDGLLRQRAILTLSHLAARKSADAALVERLTKFLDLQMREHPQEAVWRIEKYQLLLALDQSKELEKELTQWVVGADPANQWRLALGYLLAEQGRVAEAIKLFEAIEASDELGPKEYRTLAAWYLVENRREQHEKAEISVYKTTDENTLYQLLAMHLRAWQRTDGHLPTQLNKDIFLVFKVLFEKSTRPNQLFSYLQYFYQASHDFRLLSMLPDGVVGHSANMVYSFFQNMSSVIGEIRDEAAADEITARIAQVRLTAKTAIDLRALDMLELLVERRAAELQNQPGPHASKALAALERAFKREWSKGEPVLMANFLAGLGNIPQPAIAKEQLRQLEVMHREATKGSFDRLHIALRQAQTVDRYSQHAEAMDLLQSALKEYEEASGNILPTSANEAFGVLINFTANAKQFMRGEKLLLDQLKKPIHVQQKNWLIERLNDHYRSALQNGGEVTLGKGAMLYKVLEQKLFADLATIDPIHRSRLLGQVTSLYRIAHYWKIAGVIEDLRAFAFKRLPPLLKEQFDFYDQIVSDVADTLQKLAGTRDGIEFLLDQVESEPSWVRFTTQDGWNRYSGLLGAWRLDVKELGDLEPRLLKFVLTELRRDLRMREPRNRSIYDLQRNFYWSQKETDFAKATEEVLAERKQSSASVEYIADYLFSGLARKNRAIEILFAAHQQKILSGTGEWQLVNFLHLTSRYAESIPLLLPLVKQRPDEIAYSTKLMYAYYQTGKEAELLALLKETDSYFHKKNWWDESAIASLAYSCLETHLYSQSAAYYEELIPLHQRSHPRQVGDNTLSTYYSHAAEAYAGLGKTKEAVDKASGAIVCWGPTQNERKTALEALVRVLVASPDLVGYANELDKEKLQSAIVRKAIGQAYIKKGDHARAIPQFLLAAELQPNDTEIFNALVDCYDQIGDKEGAVRQLLQAVELSRRNIKLYEELGKRLADSKQAKESERAYTSIVEMLPNESESHAMLAEVREKQDRWQEAIAHWKRVAEIRSLEPTGLLRLAAAEIHEKAWDSAKTALRKLRNQSWPTRFNNVEKQLHDMEIKLEQGPKK